MADFWAEFVELYKAFRKRHPKKRDADIVEGTGVPTSTLTEWKSKTSGLPKDLNKFYAIVVALGSSEEEWEPKIGRLVDANDRFNAAKRLRDRRNGQAASDMTGVSDGGPGGDGADDHEPRDGELGSVDGTVEDEYHSGSAASASSNTSQVAHNITHVSVTIPEPASPPHESSSRQTRWQRLTQGFTWWWGVIIGGALGAVVVVVSLLVGSSSTPEAAAGSVTSSASTVTQVAPTTTPSTSASTTSATSTSTSPPAPAATSAPTDNTPQQTETAPPAIVDVPLQPTHADTDPAPAVPGGHCKKVVAGDIRVFKYPNNNEQPWTTWPKGTHFWIEPGEGTSDPARYRTVLRNERHGWVTKDTQYVVAANPSDCPLV